jgi:hypothetical protein
MNIKTDTGGLKSMVRGGTGEMFQMGFSGQGYVMVQPAENVVTTGGPGQVAADCSAASWVSSRHDRGVMPRSPAIC